MLDAQTKRRIDSARDILVGKVPDPKSQVEQITFALIYKFMDDMDQLSVSIGGDPSFFTNGYEQFAWSKLMDKRLGGEARLDLYVRALDQMSQNPYIPQLFRDIFKGAFLPYRDGETLNLFLKEANGFSYTHSEDLGDAYEYLLAIFASQGKAGQFRTPRHIIDFIVDCVNPGKDDTVLDPACGTAGFLISAYKHILQAQTQTPLSPDEKKRLTENLVGYDIAPDMVRLSRVNMYLHQFPNPTIHEYDTLTTEDRWDENFDVILANPPFMTPKGGIRPHKRFAVRANRSEVLFVDYIAEHLNPGGRAGVIVPEGIIFQSNNAYKALRKMLVEENYLYAVVSLPAGIFNPYSGVKTSILLMDKTLARQSDSVLFLKVAADGYDLGAQRREIERNDVPEVLRLMKAFQADPSAPLPEGGLAQVVSKRQLAESGEYNLSAERYRSNGVVQSKWPMEKIGQLCTVISGQSPEGKYYNDTGQGTPFYQGKTDFTNMFIGPPTKWTTQETKIAQQDDILMSVRAPVGPVNIATQRICIGRGLAAIRPNKDIVNSSYVFYLLRFLEKLIIGNSGSTFASINHKEIQAIEIPLPPIEVQQQIVDEIESYQKVIDGARQVVENYKPVITIDPTWPIVNLGNLCMIERGASPRPINDFVTNEPDGVNWIKIGDTKVGAKYIKHTKEKITVAGAAKSRFVKPGDFILSNSMSFGRPYIMGIEGYIHDGWLLISQISIDLDKDFLYSILGTKFVREQFKRAATGGVVNNLNSGIVRNVKIPLPPTSIQKRIAAELDEEQAFIDANKSLIKRFELKISDHIQLVWGSNKSVE